MYRPLSAPCDAGDGQPAQRARRRRTPRPPARPRPTHVLVAGVHPAGVPEPHDDRRPRGADQHGRVGEVGRRPRQHRAEASRPRSSAGVPPAAGRPPRRRRPRPPATSAAAGRRRRPCADRRPPPRGRGRRWHGPPVTTPRVRSRCRGTRRCAAGSAGAGQRRRQVEDGVARARTCRSRRATRRPDGDQSALCRGRLRCRSPPGRRRRRSAARTADAAAAAPCEPISSSLVSSSATGVSGSAPASTATEATRPRLHVAAPRPPPARRGRRRTDRAPTRRRRAPGRCRCGQASSSCGRPGSVGVRSSVQGWSGSPLVVTSRCGARFRQVGDDAHRVPLRRGVPETVTSTSSRRADDVQTGSRVALPGAAATIGLLLPQVLGTRTTRRRSCRRPRCRTGAPRTRRSRS